jgi:molybdopterin converting factor small subunit
LSKVNISLSGTLAALAGTRKIRVEASILSQALESLSSNFGDDFKERLFDSKGSPRRFINIYINGRDYRFLKKLETPLSNDDDIYIIPAASGG